MLYLIMRSGDSRRIREVHSIATGQELNAWFPGIINKFSNTLIKSKNQALQIIHQGRQP